MIAEQEYAQRLIEFLRGGKASDAVWDEVGKALTAESEMCGAMLLDVEMGTAIQCKCGERYWIGDGDEWETCEECGKPLMCEE